MPRTVTRFVTGHDAQGKSVFLDAGAPRQVDPRGGVRFFEMWRTDAMPAPVGSEEYPPKDDQPVRLPPGPNGTVIRIVDLEPGHVKRMPARADGRHPGFHRTKSIDYGVLIEGELYLILDDSEELMLPGDVAIQRGTDHAWENRGDVTARIAFILIDAEFSDELKEKLQGAEIHERPLRGA